MYLGSKLSICLEMFYRTNALFHVCISDKIFLSVHWFFIWIFNVVFSVYPIPRIKFLKRWVSPPQVPYSLSNIFQSQKFRYTGRTEREIMSEISLQSLQLTHTNNSTDTSPTKVAQAQSCPTSPTSELSTDGLRGKYFFIFHIFPNGVVHKWWRR